MIRGFFILLAFQLVGEAAARGLGLPAPGPVIGLALMVVALGLYQRWRPLDNDRARRIDGVNLKRVLRQIEPDPRDRTP